MWDRAFGRHVVDAIEPRGDGEVDGGNQVVVVQELRGRSGAAHADRKAVAKDLREMAVDRGADHRHGTQDGDG